MAKEEAFKFYDRGGVALQRTLVNSGTSRIAGFKGLRRVMIKRFVKAEPADSKYASAIAPSAAEDLVLYNGTSVRIPEIEIDGFKRVTSSQVAANAEHLATPMSIVHYKMNQGNVTALNGALSQEAMAHKPLKWTRVELVAVSFLGLVILSMFVTVIATYFSVQKEKRQKRLESEVIDMERLVKLPRSTVRPANSGAGMYNVDFNQV